MSYSNVMPIEPLLSMFKSWPDNDILDMKRLRIKVISLLALMAMLRPSDIAPRACVRDSDSGSRPIVFSKDNVSFMADGSVQLTIFGVKNDAQRTGFNVTVRPHSDHVCCPVRALRCYIQRTDIHRSRAQQPVFFTLRAPFKHVTADGIARDLNSAIEWAGLDRKLYSAKCFRPTGATRAVELSQNPEIVRKVGRWKSSEVFFQHYVHAKPSPSFTDILLNTEK